MKAIWIPGWTSEWTQDGLCDKANQRHTEIIMKELELVRADVPGEKLTCNEEDEEQLTSGEAEYHGMVNTVRHIEVCQLWCQDSVKKGEIKTMNLSTHENVADALIKCVSKKHNDNAH